MGRPIVWLAGLLALVLLAVLCAFHHRENIENDLIERAQAELVADFTDLTIHAEGRDLALEGTVPSDDARRRALAAAEVYGVRVVRDRLQIAGGENQGTAATTAEATTPTDPESTAGAEPQALWQVAAEYDADGLLQWQGRLSSQAHDRLMQESTLWLGAEGHGSQVATDDTPSQTPSPGAQQAIFAALPFLKNVSQASLLATPDRLVFRGRPSSVRQAETVRAGLAAALPAGMELETQWDRQWQPADLLLEAKGRRDGWLLTGLVPEGRRDHWRSAVIAAGLEPLDEHLLEAKVTAPDGFGRGFQAALPEIGNLTNARLVETPDRLKVDGLSEQDGIQDRLRESLAQAVGSGLNLDVGIASGLSQDQCQSDLEAQLAAEKIRFASGSARLSEQSDLLLQRLADTLRRCPASAVSVEGHTDSDGGDDFNQALSKRRADAVARRLTALGVAAGRLASEGFGETRPLAGNDTAAGKAQNRRIEFRLREGQ